MLFSSFDFDIVCGGSVIGLSLIHNAKIRNIFNIKRKGLGKCDL